LSDKYHRRLTKTNSRTRIVSSRQLSTSDDNLQENAGTGRQTSRRQEHDLEGNKPLPLADPWWRFRFRRCRRDGGRQAEDDGPKGMASLAAAAERRRSWSRGRGKGSLGDELEPWRNGKRGKGRQRGSVKARCDPVCEGGKGTCTGFMDL